MPRRIKSSEKHQHALEGKEFLISQIIEQAQLEGVSLSGVERKMLYFTESEDESPGVDAAALNDKFEAECDAAEYEEKIAKLVGHAFIRNRKISAEAEKRWRQTVTDLEQEDHYILVMVRQAMRSIRPPLDRLKLWGTGLGIFVAAMCVPFLLDKYGIDIGRNSRYRDLFPMLIWMSAVAMAVLYFVLGLFLGQRRRDDLLDRVIERAVRWSGRSA